MWIRLKSSCISISHWVFFFYPTLFCSHLSNWRVILASCHFYYCLPETNAVAYFIFFLSVTLSWEQHYFTRLSQERQIAALICHWLSLVAYCLAQWFKVRLTDMSQLEPLRTGQLCCRNTEWWNGKKDRQERKLWKTF